MSAAPLRRGACPTLPAPMATGDGLLARLALAGPMSPAQLAGLARLAASCGNGIVEVTARGNLQVRGLSAASAGALAQGIGDLGIAVREGLGIEVGPLAGLDPAEAFGGRPLAAEISRCAAPLAGRLAPKVCVIVDGGGALHLDGVAADIRIREAGGGPMALSAGGVQLGSIRQEDAAGAVGRLLGLLAARGQASRMAALVREEGVAPVRAALAGYAVGALVASERPAAEPVGMHPLTERGGALGIGLAFGQSDGCSLLRLAEIAEDAGVTGIAASFGRALLLIGPTVHLTALTGRLAAAGFIVDPADPRRVVSACPGRPACGSGRLETRRLAAALAPLAAGRSLHVSGCMKGCAHPGPAFLTIVGLDGGAGLVLEGGPRDAAFAQVPEAELELRARRLLETGGG